LRRFIVSVMLFFLIMQIPGVTKGAEAPFPVHIEGYDTIIVGYFDCWLHADGVTWQDTDHDGVPDVPGDGKTKEVDMVVVIPEGLEAQFDDITYKLVPFASNLADERMKAMFARGGGYFSGVIKPGEPPEVCQDFDAFFRKILRYRPDDYRLKAGTVNRVSLVFPMDDDEHTLKIKQPWQGELVQGRRKLLPALVEFYGVPKAAPAGTGGKNRGDGPLDLSVDIVRATEYAAAGNPVSVRAEIRHNRPGQYVNTRVVWRLNGEIIKDMPDFGLIGTHGDAVTFTMPEGDVDIEVEVNPGRDRPQDEPEWVNNKDGRRIGAVINGVREQQDSLVKVRIVAPSVVESDLKTERGKFSYTVIVESTSSYYLVCETESWTDPETGEEYSSSYCYPVYNVSETQVKSWTRGGLLVTRYNPFDRSDRTDVAREMDNPIQKYSVQGPDWTTRSFKYDHLQVGTLQDHYVTIYAEATVEGQTARATKKVLIKARPETTYGIQLTR